MYQNSAAEEWAGSSGLHESRSGSPSAYSGEVERRFRPAVKDRALGRRTLGEFATIVTPDTILRWYRQLIAAKYDGRVPRNPQSRRCDNSETTGQESELERIRRAVCAIYQGRVFEPGRPDRRATFSPRHQVAHSKPQLPATTNLRSKHRFES
jgi:hypothetical protein